MGDIMLKMITGSLLMVGILGGFLFMPHFVEYSYFNRLDFGVNNLLFLIFGIFIGLLFYREFFTVEEFDSSDREFLETVKTHVQNNDAIKIQQIETSEGLTKFKASKLEGGLNG